MTSAPNDCVSIHFLRSIRHLYTCKCAAVDSIQLNSYFGQFGGLETVLVLRRGQYLFQARPQ